jgi:hypothetical protein
MDQVSTAGYALGSVGGGILGLNLVVIQSPERFGLADKRAALPSRERLAARC